MEKGTGKKKKRKIEKRTRKGGVRIGSEGESKKLRISGKKREIFFQISRFFFVQEQSQINYNSHVTHPKTVPPRYCLTYSMKWYQV